MSNYNLDAVVKVVAVGIPALLIVLGFFAYVGGYVGEIVAGDEGMKNFGIVLIASGIILYVIEFAVFIYGEYGT